MTKQKSIFDPACHEDMPDELLKQMSFANGLGPRQEQVARILGLVDEPLDKDEILVGAWKTTGTIPQKQKITAAISSMVRSELLDVFKGAPGESTRYGLSGKGHVMLRALKKQD